MPAKKLTNIAEVRTTKTLSDIQADMSTLYEEVRAGEVELKAAAELANIAGKYLKAEQLKLAREIFIAEKNRMSKLRDAAAAELVTKD